MAITDAFLSKKEPQLFGIELTIWGAIQTRKNEPIKKSKEIKSGNFCQSNVERAITKWDSDWSNIVIVILKNAQLKVH